VNGGRKIATDHRQTLTATEITPENMNKLSQHCAEFLIHA